MSAPTATTWSPGWIGKAGRRDRAPGSPGSSPNTARGRISSGRGPCCWAWTGACAPSNSTAWPATGSSAGTSNRARPCPGKSRAWSAWASPPSTAGAGPGGGMRPWVQIVHSPRGRFWATIRPDPVGQLPDRAHRPGLGPERGRHAGHHRHHPRVLLRRTEILSATRSVAKNTILLTIGLFSGRVLALFLRKKMTPILGTDGLGILVTAIEHQHHPADGVALRAGRAADPRDHPRQGPDPAAVLGDAADPLADQRRQLPVHLRFRQRGGLRCAAPRGHPDPDPGHLHRVGRHGLRLGAAGPREGPVPDRGADRLGGGLLRAGLVVAGCGLRRDGRDLGQPGQPGRAAGGHGAADVRQDRTLDLEGPGRPTPCRACGTWPSSGCPCSWPRPSA